MADGNDNPSGTPAPAPAPTPAPSQNSGIPQEEVNRIAAREKEEGRRSAERALLEKLGVSSIDEAQQVLADKKAQDDAKLSEVEKREKTANDALTKAEKLSQEATAGAHRGRIERAVLEKLLGDNASQLQVAATITRLVDLEVGADDKALATAIDALATTMPQLFAVVSGDGKPNPSPPARPVGSAPGAPRPPAQPSKGDAASQAKTLLDQRHPKRQQRS